MNLVEGKRDQGRALIERGSDSTLVMRLVGPWHLRSDVPSATLFMRELSSDPLPEQLAYDTAQLTEWDSGLVAFLTQIGEFCHSHGIVENREGLPAGLRRLLGLAEAVPEKKGARGADDRGSRFSPV